MKKVRNSTWRDETENHVKSGAKIKRVFLLLICSMAAVYSFAQTWNCGYPNPTDVTATLKDGILTISGNGNMENYDPIRPNPCPWDKHRAEIVQVKINDGIKNIGDYAFSDCTGLLSVSIGNQVEIIGKGAFQVCPGLTSILIPNSVVDIEWGSFNHCTGLISVFIGNSVKNIKGVAFSYCTSLTSITISNSVESIGELAFGDCTNLALVIIGNGVEDLGSSVFARCTGLTSVVIGKKVKSIERYAFSGCPGITSITCYASTPPVISNNAFYDINNTTCTLCVPVKSHADYKKAAGWKEFF